MAMKKAAPKKTDPKPPKTSMKQMAKDDPKKKAPVKKGDEPVRVGRAAQQKPLSGEGYRKKPVIYPNGSLGPSIQSDMGDDRAFQRVVDRARKQSKGFQQTKMANTMKYKNRLERKKGQ
jgi:hypothetical protein